MLCSFLGYMGLYRLKKAIAGTLATGGSAAPEIPLKSKCFMAFLGRTQG